MVGSAIIKKLLSSGYTHIVSNYHRRKPDINTLSILNLSQDVNLLKFTQLDLTRQSDVENFFERERPEYLFLAAAKVGGILANNTYKAEFIYDNLAIAVNVVNAAYKYGAKKLLNLGSSCIYPKFSPQPMKEGHLLTGTLEPTNEPYAVAKIAAIKLCRYYNEQYGTNFISVMPTNLYGSNDNFNLDTSHVLPALIRKMHLGKCIQNGDFESVRKDLKKYPLYDNESAQLGTKPGEAVFESQSKTSPPYEGGDKGEVATSVGQRTNSDIINLISNFGIKTVFANNASYSSENESQITHYGSRVADNGSRLTNHGCRKVTVEVWGSGEPLREFLSVDDLADACVFLINRYNYNDIGEFINIGTGEDIKIKDLVKSIKEIVGFEGEVDYDRTKPDGTPRKLLEVSKIKALGWKPTIGLEEGIQKTYEWYISQHLKEVC